MERDAEELIRELFHLRTAMRLRRQAEIEDALVAIGVPALGPLVKALRPRPTGALRFFVFGNEPALSVVKALGRIGDPRAAGPLEEVMRRRSTVLGQPAAEALAAIGDRSALDRLAAILGPQAPYPMTDVVCAAAQALARRGDNRDVAALGHALDRFAREVSSECDQEQRKAALEVVVARLAQLGGPEATARLIAHLDADFISEEIIARLGPMAIPRLVGELRSANIIRADRALAALIQIGAPSVEALRPYVRRDPTEFGGRCAVGLCHLGVLEPELLAPVIKAVDLAWSRPLALQALVLLTRRYRDPILRTAIPVLQRLVRQGRVARSLLLTDSILDTCESLLVEIERRTESLKSLPVTATPPHSDVRKNLPRVSEEAPDQ